jgi:septum formation protein
MEIDQQKANLKLSGTFILASGSPRRKELLSELVSEFQVIPSTAEEIKIHPQGPVALISENAKIKAGDVAREYPKAWVLGADTLVFLEEKPFGKPRDMEQATKMLLTLSGKTHTVATGICLKNISVDKEIIFSEESFVTFKKLSVEMIESYFQVVDPLDKAGAYAIQTNPDMIIERWEGSLSNVIGLPVERLREELKHLKLGS